MFIEFMYSLFKICLDCKKKEKKRKRKDRCTFFSFINNLINNFY